MEYLKLLFTIKLPFVDTDSKQQQRAQPRLRCGLDYKVSP